MIFKKTVKLLGRAKVWQQRVSTYVSLVNFFMIFYLYIIESPLGLEWYHWLILVVIGVISLLFVDIKFIMPSALGYNFTKNPMYMEMYRNIEEIKKKLEEK